MTFGRRSEQLGALSTVWCDVRTKVGPGAQEGPLWGTLLLRLSPTLDTTDAPKYCNQNGHQTRSQSPETLLPTAVAARACRNAQGKGLNVGWIHTAENEICQIRPSLLTSRDIYIYILQID